MDIFLKDIMNVSSYDEVGKNRKYIDYGNSIFSKIIVPILYLLLVIFYGFIKLDFEVDIFSDIKNLLNSLPDFVLAVINLVFEFIYIIGTILYSNYDKFWECLTFLMIIIIYLGSNNWFYEKFLDNEIYYKDGRIRQPNYISAFRKTFNFLIFTMTDFGVIYSFVSIHLGKEIISVIKPDLFIFLFIAYLIKLVFLIIVKLFENFYYETYDHLKIEGYMNSNNDIFYRFSVLDHKKIDVDIDFGKSNLVGKHVYFLKDTYIKENRFLSILVKEYKSTRGRFWVEKKYYSNDFDEVKYVFEKYIEEEDER